jgi:hypothetical protein
MPSRPRSTPKEDADFLGARDLESELLRTPWNRKLWKLYNFYGRFFMDLKFGGPASREASGRPGEPVKTSKFYAEYLRFRARRRKTDRSRH